MKTVWALVPVVAVVGIYGMNRPTNERKLEVVGGRSSVTFFPSLVQSFGLRVKTEPSADGGTGSAESATGYTIGNSNLKFTLVDGRLTAFNGGQIEHKGGFTISSGRANLIVNSFRIVPSRNLADGLQLTIGSGSAAFAAFDLRHPRYLFTPENNTLHVGHMDLIVTLEAAQRLGKPELAGQLIGTLDVAGLSKPIDGLGEVEIPEPDPQGEDAPIDVAISNMGSLTSLGRMGTFPNGMNGLSMSTTSCNVGTSNIPWFAPMNVNHPVIAMNLYRLKDGEFEQVGWSWLKHGFFATNSPGCGTCQSPGTGTLLGPNCSDTYGTGNNGDRNYLGDRNEVNPFTGVWTCQNSYFSGYQNDCVRRNNGSEFINPPNPVAHRLEVHDADLGNANAQYFYEAYYINANDFDKYNNVASRTATMTWSTAQNRWNFTTTDSGQTQGPAINRWGELRSFAMPRTEGDVIVAVQTTNLGNGMWRYSYAVYNHDLDRQVREFSVPVPTGATVQNLSFRDIDRDANNQWSGVVANGKVTWSTGTFGSSTANPLKYSSVFNFRFETNVPPATGDVALGLFKPGTGTELLASTKAPATFSQFASYNLINAIEFGGNLASLASSDDNRLELGPTGDGSRSGSGLSASITGPSGAVNSITLGVEAKNTLTASGTQTLALWNWNTSAWELLDTRPTTTVDSLTVVTVNANADRFVNASTREVRARVINMGPGESGNRWRMAIDMLGIKFN